MKRKAESDDKIRRTGDFKRKIKEGELDLKDDSELKHEYSKILKSSVTDIVCREMRPKV